VKGPLPRTGATALFATRQGALLVGFTSGEVVRIDGLAVQAGRIPKQPIDRVDALVEDASGTVWVVAQGRAYRERFDHFCARECEQLCMRLCPPRCADLPQRLPLLLRALVRSLAYNPNPKKEDYPCASLEFACLSRQAKPKHGTIAL